MYTLLICLGVCLFACLYPIKMFEETHMTVLHLNEKYLPNVRLPRIQ